MKTCRIYGDLAADRADENYPTVPVCDECAKASAEDGENTAIVAEMPYDPSLGDECHFCGKTREEEKEELGR